MPTAVTFAHTDAVGVRLRCGRHGRRLLLIVVEVAALGAVFCRTAWHVIQRAAAVELDKPPSKCWILQLLAHGREPWKRLPSRARPPSPLGKHQWALVRQGRNKSRPKRQALKHLP